MIALPIESLRDQAHIGSFTLKAALLRVFGKMSLKRKILDNATKKKKVKKPALDAEKY